jgi:hypothetical protein
VNLLLATATLSTQNVTTVATPYTLQFTGSGTVTLSGTSTAGPLVGGGTLTFTPTAGTLTLTVSGSVTVAQLEVGSTATRYQAVVTATNYDVSGFSVFEQFDGVDDALASATVAAGVVGNSNMYCAMLVKRLNATQVVAIYNTAGVNPYFFYAQTGGATACSLESAGSIATVYVNGVAVPGGAAATAAQLAAAIPVGSWSVLEAINLNLSGWTAFAMAAYTGYPFNANIDEIVLAPTPSAAVRAQVRRDLYALVGMTGA